MPNSDPGAPDVQPELDSPHAVPLGKWQRIAATTIGLSLTGGGMVSIFLAKGEAGSVALSLFQPEVAGHGLSQA
ncbi:hypothetical protein [Streptosporangium saharense]|uniref:hypothetical protein n=1 Tax=Streptosporangium saharense TaxID=1706840 RepID=UPI0033191785